ncbi:hypothetical protein MMC26_005132 [Xylographa opegraphella]|nr:hypothetical protein [Xylographa opegraphella]
MAAAVREDVFLDKHGGYGGCFRYKTQLILGRGTEDSYSVTRTVDGQPYLLSLTDTAGQEEYRSLWASSNLRSDAFLLVYDITSPGSLHDTLPYFLGMIDMEADNREDTGQVPPVKIVAGNKCDLKEERRVSSREGLEWARARGCGFMETSARECVNVEETFALIVRRVVEARRLHALPRSEKAAAAAATGPHHAAGNSFSRTQPLTPLNEKGAPLGGVDGADREGGKVRGRAWWAKLRCW